MCFRIVVATFSTLHAEAHTAALLRVGGSLALHLLADLDVDVEELGDTAVQADGLALVQVTFAVVGGNALLGAGLGETAQILAIDFSRVQPAGSSKEASNCRIDGIQMTHRVNMSEIISTSVSAAASFCSEDILGWPPKRKDIVK